MGNVGLGATKGIHPRVYLSFNYMETGHFLILQRNNTSYSCDVFRGPCMTLFNLQHCSVKNLEYGSFKEMSYMFYSQESI